MKRSLVVLLVAAALSAAGSVQPACAPVLVELCAAEGCSSCVNVIAV